MPYQRSTISIESFEAVHAANIYQEAETKDKALGTYTHDAGARQTILRMTFKQIFY